MLTLGQAAKHCCVSKGTISKAISSGKLSATRREDGSWCIDGSELARYVEANGHRFPAGNGAAPVAGEQPETAPPTHPATDMLVAELRAVIADLRVDRDHWREQAQQLALPAPKPEGKLGEPAPVELPAAPALAERRPWWRRLAGRSPMSQPTAIVIAGTLIAAAIALTNHWTFAVVPGEINTTLRMNRWTGSIVLCGRSSPSTPFELRCPWGPNP
jgi:excisionase family DNA binding protein